MKKETKSVGVARQSSGTAGRIENWQVGVFLGYATSRGRAMLGRALYLPEEWADDPGRRKVAGASAAVRFATKLLVARRMIERAVAAGVPARWVTADAVYGSDYGFRSALEENGAGLRGRRADRPRRLGRVPAGAGQGGSAPALTSRAPQRPLSETPSWPAISISTAQRLTSSAPLTRPATTT
jgi:SRSO17 transposase